MVLTAALLYAVGPLLIKHRLAGVPPIGVAAGMMSVAALVTLPLLLAAPPPHAPGAGTVAGLLVLGAGSTGVAFVWWFTVMREVGPGRGALVAYLAPPFAVLYGTVFLGEHLGVGAVVGVVLILAGSWLGRRRARQPKRTFPFDWARACARSMKSRRFVAARNSRVTRRSRAFSERRSSSPCLASSPKSTVAAIR